MSVTFPLTSRVAITSGELRTRLSTAKIFVAGRVSPPAAADRFTGDVFGKIGHGAACGLQDDALLAPVHVVHVTGELKDRPRKGLGYDTPAVRFATETAAVTTR